MFTVAVTGTALLQYQWYAGPSGDVSHPLSGATNPTFTVTSASTNAVSWVSVRNSLGTVDSEAAWLAVFPANAARLGLQFISGLPALEIDGLVGTTYRVESNTNLATTNWTRVIDLTLPSSPYPFIDAGASGTTPRFYRVVVP